MRKDRFIGKRALTKHGLGTIVDKETICDDFPRWGIKLDNNPFNYSPVYYFKKEFEILKDDYGAT